LDFAGIGNIGASLIASEGSRGLASHPGIVGVRFRKAHVFDYPLGEARLLVLYSDGLQTRWNLRDYPGLVHRHPAIIAALLHRDFCRGRDDVTVLALNLEAPRG
ncbi:MAG: ATP-binding protein, partial [Gammaproteobacteria bacterium]|nr:ATP-binding protein [Gammaproteobacteria bacterium]